MKSVKEIKDLIDEKVEKRGALGALLTVEKRLMTKEERVNFETLCSEIDGLRDELELARTFEADQNLINMRVLPVHGAGAPKEDKDIKRYSFTRALLLQSEGKVLDGLEGEMHIEAVKEMRAFGESPKGLGIPQMVLQSRAGHNATTAGEGKNIVETNLRTDKFVDVLFANTFLDKVGATKMTGLVGNIEIPVQANPATVATVTETGVAADTQLAFSKLTLNPGRIAAKAPVTKQLLIQDSMAVDAYLLKLFMKQFALKINADAYTVLDTAVADNALTGANGIALSWDILVGLQKSLADYDIQNEDAWKFLTNPSVRSKAKRTTKLANSITQSLWEDGNKMNGFDAVVTNLVSSTITKGSSGATLSRTFLGDFSELIYGQWGGMDVITDIYTLAAEGQIRLLADMFMGYVVTRPTAFTKVGLITV